MKTKHMVAQPESVGSLNEGPGPGRFGWRRRILLWFVVASLLLVPIDTSRLSPSQTVVAPYMFSVLQWEATHFFRKWTHLFWDSIQGEKPTRHRRLAILDQYLLLARMVEKEKSRLEGSIVRPIATEAQPGLGKDAAGISRDYLQNLVDYKESLRNKAEEVVEAEISSVLNNEGLSVWGQLIFPPVDIWLGEPPTVLVVSPRDRINRQELVLLIADINPVERDRIETEIYEEHGLSSLVIDLSGLATYPTIVSDLDPMRSILRTACHEWIHAYFFFRSLGQGIYDSDDMWTLNESAADLAGRELGDLVFASIGGDLTDSARKFLPSEERDPFFTSYLRETQQEVRELLDNERVEEAEQYMKERWWQLRLGGYRLRKLNQAFFAFHEVYASSPASISPIGDELEELRGLQPGLGPFIRAISSVSSYPEFLKLLDQLRQEAATEG